MVTLLDLVERIRALGGREAVRWTNGIQTRRWSYADLVDRMERFALFLEHRGMGPGDRIVVWSENRPEWVAVFWGALLRGVVVVPLDHHTSPDRLRRVRDESEATLVVAGRRRPELRAGEAVPMFGIEEMDGLPENGAPGPRPAIGPDDMVEILYTSGTTDDPRGVVHRHRHIVANLNPIASEIDRYRLWARPFQPIRFLDVIPLSHMFGQAMGVFIPPLIGGSVVFTSELDSGSIQRTIRAQSVSVLVSVPRIAAGLRRHVERHFPSTRERPSDTRGVLRRLWRHRRIHGAFGWKFWAIVVGGARLDEALEDFWNRIGVVVVQGYGLTETSPVVAVNHPFHARRGTLGKAIRGQEVSLADDGEILVRGPSVVEEYVAKGGTTRTLDGAGWFHTGDIGEMDGEGRLVYRGRKKDVIVTGEGTNIHPDDVESVLESISGVRSSVVVAAPGPDGDRPHAALILVPGADAAVVIDEANRRLEPAERIRSWSIWPDEDFPRTPSTLKVQRRLVAEAIRSESGVKGEPSGFADFVAQSTRIPRSRLEDADTKLDDLGLTSLERVELLSGIEERYGIEIDEADFASIPTLGEMAKTVEAGRDAARSPAMERAHVAPPRWARRVIPRAVGAVLRTVLVRPMLGYFVRVETLHSARLDALEPPVILAATHTSHLDTPVVFQALGPAWRGRIAPAMRQEYFFPPGGKPTLGGRLAYVLVCLAFHAYPLPQQMGQVRSALRYTGELVGAGYCPLVFPEGRLTRDGAIQDFRPGIGFMAAHLDVPVLPLRIEGAYDVFPTGSWWPGKGTVKVRVGEPLRYAPGEGYAEFAKRLETRIREME